MQVCEGISRIGLLEVCFLRVEKKSFWATSRSKCVFSFSDLFTTVETKAFLPDTERDSYVVGVCDSQAWWVNSLVTQTFVELGARKKIP